MSQSFSATIIVQILNQQFTLKKRSNLNVFFLLPTPAYIVDGSQSS